MPQAWMAFLLAAVVSPPTPQPALKTIVTVHSSQFCTDLILAVKPALVGLMRNDQLIDLGHSALKRGDSDVKFGGTAESSFNQQGAATWTVNEGDITFLNNRQRQLAAAMANNIDMVKAVLANPNAPAPSGDDKAKLASIEAELNAVIGEQRQAIDIIQGNADTADLAAAYNAPSATGIESDNPNLPTTQAGLNGISPLDAQLTSQHNLVGGPGKGKIATTDPTTQAQNAIAQAANSSVFNNPYGKLARALEMDQSLIGKSEDSAAKAIVDAAIECQ